MDKYITRSDLLEQVARLEAQARIVAEATGPLEDSVRHLQIEVNHWKARGQVLELLLEKTPLEAKFFSIHDQLSEIERHLSAVESVTEGLPEMEVEITMANRRYLKIGLLGRLKMLITGHG